jgi:hypothetical protein
MERAPKLEVDDWRAPSRQTSSNALRSRDGLYDKYVAFFVALVLHALAFQTVQFGEPQKAKLPEVQSSSSLTAKTEGSETLEVVTLVPAAQSEQNVVVNVLSRSDIKNLVAKRVEVTLPNLSEPSLPLSEDDTQKNAGGEGDLQDRARLFGIYTGQIRARIERVWRRPRTAVIKRPRTAPSDAEESFRCRAQILQDAHGNVQEILLHDCDESPAWQRSLVIAIQQASPLPAPPRASVFTKSIVLDFNGLPFTSASAEDEYELPSRMSAYAATPDIRK